ncbi:hypothetical protein RvY_00016 [Ramazzottius varieornatus]|uniref:Uncharacterized protein n=1 Tax=Ramazzottius varieornatus TaxID=947166 RepID=A0A1D1UB55_RAMVA|nr:hypothetical protein RvY_00016 [Ramazzottius varieornatus]
MAEDNVGGKEGRLRYKLSIASRLLYKLIKDTRMLEADRQRLLTENQQIKEKLGHSLAQFDINQAVNGAIAAAYSTALAANNVKGAPVSLRPPPAVVTLPLPTANGGPLMDTVWDLLK